MKDFVSVALISGGVGAMVVAICLALFAGVEASVLGGFGLLAAVIGAAIKG